MTPVFSKEKTRAALNLVSGLDAGVGSWELFFPTHPRPEFKGMGMSLNGCKATLNAMIKVVAIEHLTLLLGRQAGGEEVVPVGEQELLEQTNALAARFCAIKGNPVLLGYRFDQATDPKEVLCWTLARAAQLE